MAGSAGGIGDGGHDSSSDASAACVGIDVEQPQVRIVWVLVPIDDEVQLDAIAGESHHGCGVGGHDPAAAAGVGDRERHDGATGRWRAVGDVPLTDRR